MKKTISMLLAVLMAAIAVCTFGVSAFADETTAANDDPTDALVNTTEATTEATTAAPATEATTEATTVPATEATTEATTGLLDNIIGALVSTTKTAEEIQSELDAEPTVTNPEGQTAIPPDETQPAGTKAPATTKKPAKVESNIPNTGSTAVPVIALLALAAGTVAVVKTKKED